jgi:pantothenate kinase
MTVTGDIVLLEGNYLLLDAPGWRELRPLADYAIAIRADEAQLRQRLVARHVAGGKSAGAAARHVDQSDLRNARLCLERSLPADLRLALGDDGTFTVLE